MSANARTRFLERRGAETLALAAFFALFIPGCGAAGDSDSAFENGNLGESTFLYNCTSTADAACGANAFVVGAAPLQFPAAFAVGSRIDLRVSPTTSDQTNIGNPVVMPVSTEFLAASPASATEFTVLKQGFGAIYVKSTVDSDFVDYTLLRLVALDTLQIGDATQTAIAAPLSVSASQTVTLTALPQTDSVPVAGALDFEWTVADPTVVSITTANPTARMVLTALKSGSTTVTLTVGSLHAKTTITVL